MKEEKVKTVKDKKGVSSLTPHTNPVEVTAQEL